jgi:hypothetical protein
MAASVPFPLRLAYVSLMNRCSKMGPMMLMSAWWMTLSRKSEALIVRVFGSRTVKTVSGLGS